MFAQVLFIVCMTGFMTYIIWKLIGKKIVPEKDDFKKMRERLLTKQEQLKKLKAEIDLTENEVSVTETLNKYESQIVEITNQLTILDSKRHKKST